MPSLCIVRTYGVTDAMAADVAVATEEVRVPGGHLAEFVGDSSGPDFDPLQAGCVVARLDLESSDPTELLDRLAAQRSSLTVVYLVERPLTRSIVSLMRRGAIDVLDWPLERERLSASLKQALVASIDRQQRLREIRRVEQRLAKLNLGELEVLQLMLCGMVNKTIAIRLGIALRTVEARRNRIFVKLETKNLAAIAATLNRAGLINAAGVLLPGGYNSAAR